MDSERFSFHEFCLTLHNNRDDRELRIYFLRMTNEYTHTEQSPSVRKTWTADGRDKSCALPKTNNSSMSNAHLFLFGAHAPSSCSCSISAFGSLPTMDGNGLGISFARPSKRRQHNNSKTRTKSPRQTSKQLKRKKQTATTTTAKKNDEENEEWIYVLAILCSSSIL